MLIEALISIILLAFIISSLSYTYSKILILNRKINNINLNLYNSKQILEEIKNKEHIEKYLGMYTFENIDEIINFFSLYHSHYEKDKNKYILKIKETNMQIGIINKCNILEMEINEIKEYYIPKDCK